MEQVYADKNKTAGVQYTSTVIPAKTGTHFKNDVEGLYQEYLKAFKKGVYNYIKEEPDPITQETIPRKYFSGGTSFDEAQMALAESFTSDPAVITQPFSDRAEIVKVRIDQALRADQAMGTTRFGNKKILALVAALLLNSFPGSA